HVKTGGRKRRTGLRALGAVAGGGELYVGETGALGFGVDAGEGAVAGAAVGADDDGGVVAEGGLPEQRRHLVDADLLSIEVDLVLFGDGDEQGVAIGDL